MARFFRLAHTHTVGDLGDALKGELLIDDVEHARRIGYHASEAAGSDNARVG